MLTAFRLKDMPGFSSTSSVFSPKSLQIYLTFQYTSYFSKENDCLSKNLCYNLEQFTGFPKLESYDG